MSDDHDARNWPAVSPPGRRQLRTYAFDPMSTRLSGRFLHLDVPFEPALGRGPVGARLQVIDWDATRNCWYSPVSLNDPAVLGQDGLRPREGDPRSHQQIVYAVASSVVERFERDLGRRFRWRADRLLRLVPHAFQGRNAYFDPSIFAVLFGYYRADLTDPGANLPGQMIFTCLSSDIVAHEVTHAIVHRIRPYFSEATNPDVFAWHEAFADLVALFQHFAHRDVVTDAVAETRGTLGSEALLSLAKEFGESTGRGAALRSAIGTPATPEQFLTTEEPHARGACFVAGVFDAFLTIYRRQTDDLLRIATGGSGLLPEGQLQPDLVSRLATEAVTSANRLLGMVIRAFDYLPVVDVTFGDVVRAIVTADRALFPDDELQLRATLVEAMRRRGIVPDRISSLADDALSWPAPTALSLLDGSVVNLSDLLLSATMDLDQYGSPGAMDLAESTDQAAGDVDDPAADETTTTPEDRPESSRGSAIAWQLHAWAVAHATQIGFVPATPTTPISVAGMHVSFRQAADRQPRPELVVQFLQNRKDLEDISIKPRDRSSIRAGTALVIGVDGTVRYIIAKPLPDPSSHPAAAAPSDPLHRDASDRLAALNQWLGRLDADDPLTAWTDQPGLARLTFAQLHTNDEPAS